MLYLEFGLWCGLSHCKCRRLTTGFLLTKGESECKVESLVGGRWPAFTGALLAILGFPGWVTWIFRSGPIFKDLLMFVGRVTCTGALLAAKEAPG